MSALSDYLEAGILNNGDPVSYAKADAVEADEEAEVALERAIA